MPAKKPTLEQLIARAEIHDALMRYLRGIDRKEWDLVRSVYHDDATQPNPYARDDSEGSIDELVELIDVTHANTPRSMHFLGNIVYEFVSDDVAIVESYLVTFQVQRSEDGSEHFYEIGSRYLDRFEQRDGEWKIAKRLIPLTFTRPAAPGEDAPLYPNVLMSVRGPSDPLWQLRAEAGLD